MPVVIENNLIKYALYGTSAIILSEIGYRYFRWWMKRCADLNATRTNREIAEVIWINELTQDCAIKSPFKTSKTWHDNKNCRNPFCFPRNMGKIIAFIDNAKYSIDLSMYIFTSYDLSQTLQRAFKRGLQIRIITDKEMFFSSGSQILILHKIGIPVRYSNSINMLMHHKFCLLDGPVRSRAVSEIQKKTYENSQGILFTGSLNWTNQGFNANWENMIITSNINLISKFEEEFNRMWTSFNNVNFDG